MRRLLVAILALVAGAAMAEPPNVGSRHVISGSSSTASERETCQTGWDHAGRYIYHPENECCTTTASACATGTSGSTYKRWTRECVAEADGQPIIITGPDSTTSLGLPTMVSQTNTCFANDISGGAYSGDNQRTYIFDIEAKAAAAHKPNPLFFLAIRNDMIDAYDLATSDNDIAPPSRNWLLKTSRVWESSVGVDLGTGVIDYFEGLQGTYVTGVPQSNFSGCRFPTLPLTTNPPLAADVWDGAGGCASTEVYTPYLMAGTNATTRQNAVYYVFYRDGTTQRMFYPTGVLTDLTSPGYRAWLIRYIALRMAREHMDGFEMAHKLHFYWNATSRTYRNHWIYTGDALGGAQQDDCGLSSGVTGYVDNMNEAVLCDVLVTGPPKIRASNSDYAADTDFTYPLYVDGLQKLGHLAYTHTPRLPYVIHVNPYWYDGCTAGAVFTAANGYTDASCSTKFDDPNTAGVNEAALIRQWVQEAGYVVIDRDDGVNGTSGANNDGLGERAPTNCNPLPCDGGIGSGGGSGLSSAQLKAMIEGGSPAAIRVEVYDSSVSRSFPAKLTGASWSLNPETSLTVPTFAAECANGVDDDADGKTDMADDGCSSAADTDETHGDCADGIDNDADGFIDVADSLCSNANDESEQ